MESRQDWKDLKTKNLGGEISAPAPSKSVCIEGEEVK